jgi:P2-related tail formation protein
MTKIIRNAAQLAEAKEELADLKKAKKKILLAQSYSTDVNQVTRASLKEVSEEIEAYETAIDAYETNGSTKRRAKRVVPIG